MNLTRNLEAILFIAGDPVPIAQIAGALKCSALEARAAVDELKRTYEQRDAGLRVARSPEGVQLTTAPEAGALVESYVKAGMRERLTPAAAETLAIIAYRGPISRAGIEAIRGVNSVFTLRLLALRGLTLRKPHPKDPRRFVYELSAEFLRQLGVTRPEELPEYAELHEHAGMTKLAREAEEGEATVNRHPTSPTGLRGAGPTSPTGLQGTGQAEGDDGVPERAAHE